MLFPADLVFFLEVEPLGRRTPLAPFRSGQGPVENQIVSICRWRTIHLHKVCKI